MNAGIEHRLDKTYGRLVLTCGEREFARLRDLVCDEAAVSDGIGGPPVIQGVRTVVVSLASAGREQAREGPRWWELVPCLVAGCISGVAIIVGYVVMVQWIMRYLG